MKKQESKLIESTEKFSDEKFQIEQKLKSKHGEITKIEFAVKDKTLTAYLREPKLFELDATLSRIGSAPISSSVGMFKTCFVGGDDELLTLADNVGFAIAIHKQIQEIIPNVSASLTII